MKNMKKGILICSIMVLSILIAGCTSKTKNSVADTEEVVKISLSDLSDQVQFYTFDDKGININYFAVLGSDGKPRTAFDACDVCGGYKGYRQSGNNIVCNNCGQTFSIDGLGSKNKGYGCWPSYLPHKVEDDIILIKISDLKQGRSRFV